MFKKFLIGLGIGLVAFFAYVARRPADFRYERSDVIQASAEKIFPYLNDFKLGGEWSPYEKMDPNMKKVYAGPAAGVGATMDFDAKADVGSGRLEIIESVPASRVVLKLTMTKPMQGVNTVEYRLSPEATGTRFTWAMYGHGNFFSKLISVFIDCEKMVGAQFAAGIANLKKIVETPAP